MTSDNVNEFKAVNDATTIQQKVFVGSNVLDQKNEKIQEFIQKSGKALSDVQGEYKKVKSLLIKYKIIKEQLELNFLKKAKHIKKQFSELKRRQDELETKQKQQLIDTEKQSKNFKQMQKFINNFKGPLEKFKSKLLEMKQKGTLQEKEVRKMFKKSGIHDAKIEEYWQIIRKMDGLMEKLNTAVEKNTRYMTTEEQVSKEVAAELGELKHKLIKTTQMVGGKTLKKIAQEENVNDDFIKFISNPIQHKLNNITMSGGSNIKSEKLWVKDTPSYIFKKFNRKQLNDIAKNWGIKDAKQFKNKTQLSKALKTLMLYKGGYIKKREHCNTVCRNIGINPKQFNNIKQVQSFLNKELSKVVV